MGKYYLIVVDTGGGKISMSFRKPKADDAYEVYGLPSLGMNQVSYGSDENSAPRSWVGSTYFEIDSFPP